MVEEETNQENWKNHTINLIEELDDEETGNAVLISYIEEMKMKVWINVRISPVALRLGSEMDPYRRDLTNILHSYLVSDSFGPVLGARA